MKSKPTIAELKEILEEGGELDILPSGEVRTKTDFQVKLESLLNKCNMESASDTPDFILASFLWSCLAAFDMAVVRRTDWYKTEGPE